MTAASDAPADAVCIEPFCTQAATCLRPVSRAWLTGFGVIFDGNEWVCDDHRGDDPT